MKPTERDLLVAEAVLCWVHRDEHQETDAIRAVIEAIPEPAPLPAPCEWTPECEDDLWQTDCGHSFSFFDGGPTENRFRFCCFCGGSLTPPEDKP